MNFTESVDYIHSLLKFGIRPGLTGMNALLHLLDNPHKKLRYVHVAGTNGKGSTSTAISNVLIESGYKVGLYTSPYVSHFLERVQFNGKPVDEQIFSQSVESVKACVQKLQEEDIVITEFEALTATAFLCYKKLECDVVVLEVGLGGRLDATNVIDSSLVNVITSLSLDHTAILGDTIEAIAHEKCGTLKANCKVVSSFGQPVGAVSVIEKTVNEKNGTLVIPSKDNISVLKSALFGTEFFYKNMPYKITMPGIHQVKNMTCVIEACEFLKEFFNITLCDIQKGVEKTVLPARVEILSPKPLVILDGGHNEDGAKAFFDAVNDEISQKEKVIVIAGMMADKAVEESLKPLMKKADVFYAVTPENPRAMKAEELKVIAEKYSAEVYAFDDIKIAVEKALVCANENTAILVVGSLYLAGEIRGYLIENLKNID